MRVKDTCDFRSVLMFFMFSATDLQFRSVAGNLWPAGFPEEIASDFRKQKTNKSIEIKIIFKKLS